VAAASPPRMMDLRPNTKELDVSTFIFIWWQWCFGILQFSCHSSACCVLCSCLFRLCIAIFLNYIVSLVFWFVLKR
jgi:hypothetical protein